MIFKYTKDHLKFSAEGLRLYWVGLKRQKPEYPGSRLLRIWKLEIGRKMTQSGFSSVWLNGSTHIDNLF